MLAEDRIRVFFAIPIVKEEYRLLHHQIHAIKALLGDEVRIIPEGNWHVTVNFLGPTDCNRVALLRRRVGRLLRDVAKFPLWITKIDRFPPVFPRMIAAYVALNPPLQALKALMDECLLELDVEPETHHYLPHITLAKSHHPIKHFKTIEVNPVLIRAEQLILYESRPSQTGSHYLPLKKFAFI